MSRLVNRLCGRVYGWFDSKESNLVRMPLPTKFERRARLALVDLEDRSVPATFLVTNTGDNGGVNPAPGAGTGTLRQAIIDATAAASDDIIQFDSSFATAKTITLEAALPNLSTGGTTGALTIDGPGKQLTISGAGKFRVFNTDPGAAGQAFVFQNMTIANGSITGNGGGINLGDEAVTVSNVVIENCIATTSGGAINVAAGTGKVTIIDSIIRNNRASASHGAAVMLPSGTPSLTVTGSTISGNVSGGDGGAIYFFSGGSLNIDSSTLSGNTCGAAQGGGAIYFFGTVAAGGFQITNTTISGNVSKSAEGGGGIVLRSFNGNAKIFNSTITANSAPVGGGVSLSTGGTAPVLSIANTIVSGNTGGTTPDIRIVPLATVFNLDYSAVGVESFTVNGSNTGNLPYNSELKLGPLANSGGNTRVHMIGSGSLAIDAGDPGSTLTVDQRGKTRPVGTAIDIGAVERQTVEPPIAAAGTLANVFVNDASTNPYQFTVTYSDDVNVDASTTDDGDEIRITGPGGFSTLATYVSGAGGGNAKSLTVTYQFVPPGGTWTGTNAGTYTIAVEPNQVKNTGGTPVIAQELGSFRSLVGSTFIVTNDGDNAGGVNPAIGAGTGTLRQAIVDANNAAKQGTADTIVFDPSVFSTAKTIQLLGVLPTISDLVTITGPGSNLLTLTRGVNTTFVLLTFTDTTGISPMKLTGMKLDGKGTFAAATGTAIVTSDESVTLDDVFITNVSTTSAGGAIRVGASSTGFLTMTNSTLTGNTTSSTGAGITAYAGTKLVIDKSTISNNVATGAGGGINFTNSTVGQSLFLTNSTLSGNTSKTTTTNYGGGGISFPGSTGTSGFLVRNSTISGNSAAGSGGGIVFRALNGVLNPNVFIQNSTITNNTANSSSVTLGQGGGGIAVSTIGGTAPTLNIESTILSGNSAANGYHDLSMIATATLVSDYNAIGVQTGFTYTPGANDLSAADAAITKLNLAALALNPPGTTKTHAILAGSTAINKGSNPTNVTPALTKDQTGADRVSGSQIDIGAFERVAGVPSATIPPPATVKVDDASTNPYVFEVTYADDSNIARVTIGDAPDIAINKLGGGFSTNAIFVSADSAVNAPTIVAKYKFLPPGGSWDSADNGTYTFDMLAGAVKNDLGVAVPAGTLASLPVAFPETFVVTNTNDSGAGSLRQAIINANTNAAETFDTIEFDPSVFSTPQTITLSTGQITISDGLTIAAAKAPVTVNANNTSRIFNIDGPGVIPVSISNMVLTGGSATNEGGAIRIANEDVSLTDVTLKNNTVTGGNGGAIASLGGPNKLTILRGVLTNNSSSGAGGAIDSGPGGTSVVITESTISNNKGSSGAAIGAGEAKIALLRSTLSGNSASGSGGALRLYLGGSGHVTIVSSTISTNTSGATGGAINIFSGNATRELIIRNSTITLNKATTNAGGIGRTSTTNIVMTLESTIVAGNISVNTPDFNFATANQSIDGNNNLIGVSDKGNFTLAGLDNIVGTLDTPRNPLLGPLTNNGGLTATHAVLVGSDAIDAGTNILSLSTDQRGQSREVPSMKPDIGAYEAQAAEVLFPAAIVTKAIDVTADDPTTNPYQFNVSFFGTTTNPVDITTVTNKNTIFTITGPGGFSTTAKWISDSGMTDKVVTAVFELASIPDNGTPGVWSKEDDGTYTIAINANTVKNTPLGNAVPAGVLDTFDVLFPSLVVSNDNDSGAGSLRHAINTANSMAGADTITFTAFFNTPRTINLLSPLPALVDGVTIDGPGAAKVTISGKNAVRIFDVSAAPAATEFVFNGLTLANGSAAGNGGAILIGDEKVTVNDCVITNNTASGNGGGISIGTATGFLEVHRSTISGNKATSYGGGISQTTTGGSAKIDSSTIANNSSGTNGGGLGWFFSGLLHVTNSTISGNTGTNNCGGIYFWANVADFLVSNSTIVGNSTGGSGGGIGFRSSSGSGGIIRNSTITGNTANSTSTTIGYGGGGISLLGSGLITIESTIVSGNKSNVANGRDDLAMAASPTVLYSAIGDADGFSFGTGSDFNLPFNTDLKLAPSLADNGGPTLTILPAANSPVIGKGSNPGMLDFDQRGKGFAREVGQADIGAVERQTAAPVFQSLTINSGNIQRSRIFTIDVTFVGAVDAADFQTSGLITLTRIAPTVTLGSDGFTGIGGFVVSTSNGLQITQNGANTLRLSFANIVNNGVENTSLADGRWQLAISPASFTSSDSNPSQAIRRLFGDVDGNGQTDGTDFGFLGLSTSNPPMDIDNNGTIDGADFSSFGGRFGVTI